MYEPSGLVVVVVVVVVLEPSGFVLVEVSSVVISVSPNDVWRLVELPEPSGLVVVLEAPSND